MENSLEVLGCVEVFVQFDLPFTPALQEELGYQIEEMGCYFTGIRREEVGGPDLGHLEGTVYSFYREDVKEAFCEALVEAELYLHLKIFTTFAAEEYEQS